MKIIYLANVRMPTEKAHGIQIMKMCEAFSDQGLEVELIVPWRFNKIKKSVWEYYGQKENFRIKYLKITDFMRMAIPRISFWLQGRSFFKAVILFLKKEKADIIYSRDLAFAKQLSSLNKNIFYEMHSLPRSFNRKDLEKVKGIITITKGLKDTLIKKGIPEDKILVAPDGVDLDRFGIKEKEDVDNQREEGKKIVLYTGHLYKWKGAHILAEAAKFLNKNTMVIFIGGTESDIKEFKKKYGHIENIEIKGHLSYRLIPYWMKLADVLVLPNSAQERISKDWTSPMKMFEYMASKKPIVASDLPSLREVLNENNAILVKPDSPQALIEGIKQALKNPDFSAKISLQALQDVQKYSWSKRAKNILIFIKSI